MKLLRIIQKILIHIGIICSLALITVHILDWYNPFMDFAGHTVLILYILCGTTLLSGLIHLGID